MAAALLTNNRSGTAAFVCADHSVGCCKAESIPIQSRGHENHLVLKEPMGKPGLLARVSFHEQKIVIYVYSEGRMSHSCMSSA